MNTTTRNARARCLLGEPWEFSSSEQPLRLAGGRIHVTTFRGSDPTRGSGQEDFKAFTGRVGFGQVLTTQNIRGSGQVGSDLVNSAINKCTHTYREGHEQDSLVSLGVFIASATLRLAGDIPYMTVCATPAGTNFRPISFKPRGQKEPTWWFSEHLVEIYPYTRPSALELYRSSKQSALKFVRGGVLHLVRCHVPGYTVITIWTFHGSDPTHPWFGSGGF